MNDSPVILENKQTKKKTKHQLSSLWVNKWYQQASAVYSHLDHVFSVYTACLDYLQYI